MKKYHKIIILLTIISLCVSIDGCSKGNEKKKTINQAMGRYVEDEIALPDLDVENHEAIQTMLINPNGQCELFTFKLIRFTESYISFGIVRYILKEEGKWVCQTKWDMGDSLDQYTLNYGDDGKLYCIRYTREKGGYRSSLQELMADGTLRKISMPDWTKKDDDGEFIYINDFSVMKNGEVLAHQYNSDTAALYNTSGEKQLDFEYEDINTLSSAGDDIITINKNRDNLLIIDKNSGINKNAVAFPQGEKRQNYANVAICKDGSDNIYVANSKGLYCMKKNGSIFQTIINGDNVSLSLPSLCIVKLMKGTGDNFNIFYKEDKRDIFHLMHYEYRKDIPTIPDKALTIYSLENIDLIREASMKFMQKNPEVRIDYQVPKTENDSLSTDDYVKALNTDILSGNGADLIVCDGLPAQDYLNKGIFTDISDTIDPMAKSGKIYSNIVDCYRKDKGIYLLPMKFEACIFAGKNEILNFTDSLESMVDYYQSHADTPLLGEDLNYNDMFEWFYGLYNQKLFHNGKLDEKKLVDFLNELKKLNTYNGKEKYKNWFDTDCFLEFRQERSQLMITNISNMDTMIFTSYVLAHITQLGTTVSLAPSNGLEFGSARNSFQPYCLVGVNKKSKNKDLAKEFIKILLSEKVQNRNIDKGIPLNKNALDMWGKRDIMWLNIHGDPIPPCAHAYDPETDFRIDLPYPVNELELGKLTKIIEKLNTPVQYDTTIFHIISKEIGPFFEGKKSAEDIASVIMKKIDIYYKE